MSAARVDFTAEAILEIDEALEWYLERSLPAAEAFIHETNSAFLLIASAPAVWPRFEARTRRYVLRNFPYSVLYLEKPDRSWCWRWHTRKGSPNIGFLGCLPIPRADLPTNVLLQRGIGRERDRSSLESPL